MQLAAAMRRLLPITAIVVVALTTGITIAVAGDTFGYDFRAYHAAAGRVIAGQPLYDLTHEVAGPYGLFLYPPTFLPLVLPFGALPVGPATWAWTAAMLVSFAAAVAVMPVSMRVRWLIILVAGLSWPFVYNIKLGQVGLLLLLVFAAGWRGLERPWVVGAAGAIGAAVKLQPGIVLAWALLTRRWLAVAVGVVTLLALVAVATAITGLSAWSDFVVLITRVSDPVTTPHNFTPGAVAYQAGMPRDTAAVLQWVSTAGVVLVVIASALRLGAVPSFLVAVIASQLLSPVLWDHYALLLLLPVAWLVERGHAWALLIVLATPILAVEVLPAVVYPVLFWVTLGAVIGVGGSDARHRPPISAQERKRAAE